MQNKRMRARYLTIGAASILMACAAVLAEVQSGPGKVESLTQVAPPAQAPDAAYSVASFTALATDLAEGEGLQETQSFCVMCHSTRYITMQPPLPAAVWEAEMNKMIKTYGAPIPEPSAKKILAYLQAHYAPENRKQ